MNHPTKRFTREELCNEVWQTPLTKLGAPWGVSQAVNQRACKRLNMPRPGAGHWLLVRGGWEMEQAPLPTAGARTPAETVIGWKWRGAAQPDRRDACHWTLNIRTEPRRGWCRHRRNDSDSASRRVNNPPIITMQRRKLLVAHAQEQLLCRCERRRTNQRRQGTARTRAGKAFAGCAQAGGNVTRAQRRAGASSPPR